MYRHHKDWKIKISISTTYEHTLTSMLKPTFIPVDGPQELKELLQNLKNYVGGSKDQDNFWTMHTQTYETIPIKPLKQQNTEENQVDNHNDQRGDPVGSATLQPKP